MEKNKYKLSEIQNPKMQKEKKKRKQTICYLKTTAKKSPFEKLTQKFPGSGDF